MWQRIVVGEMGVHNTGTVALGVLDLLAHTRKGLSVTGEDEGNVK